VLVMPERALDTDSSVNGSPSSVAPASTPPASGTVQPLRVARRHAADAFERQYVQHVLRHSGGNVTRAAAAADVSRQVIHKLMVKHGV
jgi:DNA-binding NtrC family response regulator